MTLIDTACQIKFANWPVFLFLLLISGPISHFSFFLLKMATFTRQPQVCRSNNKTHIAPRERHMFVLSSRFSAKETAKTRRRFDSDCFGVIGWNSSEETSVAKRWNYLVLLTAVVSFILFNHQAQKWFICVSCFEQTKHWKANGKLLFSLSSSEF